MSKAILIIDIDDELFENGIDIENTQVTYIELECHNETAGMSLVNHWLKPLPQKYVDELDCPYGFDYMMGRMRIIMSYTNDFTGKKYMVDDLSVIYSNIEYSDIDYIELRKYRHKVNNAEEEFIVLHWGNGGISTANNNMNSLSATARNVARMLDGGVYENYDYYTEIMDSNEWDEIL